MHFTHRRFLFTGLIGLAWLAAVAFGLRFVLNYDGAAGPVGDVPQKWPAHSALHHATDRLTLVMLAHPRCPCTRATVGELAQIMATAQGKIDAYVLFYRPSDAKSDWDETDLRQSAAAIPGVKTVSDIDGVEAKHFGAETSGHTEIFDRNGKLLFSGGITESRGHAGGNNGESAILELAANQQPTQSRTLVFGCRIADRTGSKRKDLCLK